MEWPSHLLLRTQCGGREETDVEAGNSCNRNSQGSPTCSSTKYSSTCCNTCGHRASHRQADDTTSAAVSQSRSKRWKRKCVSYSRLDGWYVLGAEILGTIILIALCVVAANQARNMSEEVDTVALAALARSNPRAICVNASTDNVQGQIIQGVNLHLVPSSFRDSKGGHWKRAGIEAGLRATTGLWNFPFTSQMIPMDAVFTQTMLASMFKCGVVRGAYHSQDLPSFISRRCSRQCRYELGASLNTTSFINSNATWAFSDDINIARAHPTLEMKSVQYNVANVVNTTWVSEQLNQLLQSSTPGHADPAGGLIRVNESGSLLMFAQDDYLPGLDAIPKTLEHTYDVSRDYLIMPSTTVPSLQWMEASLYLAEDMWHLADDHQHNRHLDPRAVPAGTLRVDVFHTVPYSYAEAPKTSRGQHVSSVWFDLNQQTPKTAHCLAETASYAVKLLEKAKYTLRQPNGTVMHGVRPMDHNLTFDQLWLRVDANMDAARPYACAEGVDVTSTDATAYLTRLDAYKSTAKSQYRTTIFVSMHYQTAEDIYAVYTGALGAVFGSMALLVATLFVYAVALLKHMLTPQEQELAWKLQPCDSSCSTIDYAAQQIALQTFIKQSSGLRNVSVN